MMDLIALFEEKGDRAYGEAVTQTSHALQCVALAEAEGASPALVAAALLHDVGHLLAEHSTDVDDRHEEIGAAVLANLYGPDVAEPVRLHVAAKRWLCATDPRYFARLSPASVKSLALQGGPFTADEVASFAVGKYAGDAVRLRYWDEAAKRPDVVTRALDAYRPLLAKLECRVASST